MTSQSFHDAVDVFRQPIARSGVRNVLGCQTACYAAEPHSKRVRLLPFGF